MSGKAFKEMKIPITAGDIHNPHLLWAYNAWVLI
jgi:hypothetical protein